MSEPNDISRTISCLWKTRDFLAAAAAGSPIEARHDRYLILDNPNFKEDNGRDPKLLFDLREFENALVSLEIAMVQP